MDSSEDEVLKEELLEAAAPNPAENVTVEPPKKNTKQAILQKILEVSEKSGIPLEHSNSQLKRMNKQRLASVLADIIEQGMRRKMAQQVGVDQEADQRTIALGALRMLHDCCAMGLQNGGNMLLQPRGYEIHNFTESLKEPHVSHAIDSCLQEIAEENTELLEYIQSPYARLGIAWAGALCFCVHKKQKEHVTFMGPRSAGGETPFRGRGRRGQASRKIHIDTPPVRENVKQV